MRLSAAPERQRGVWPFLRTHWLTLSVIAFIVYVAATNLTLVPYALVVASMLGVLVLLHEAAHYLIAKRAGLGIKEFAIGFGPRLLSRDRGGVTWSLRALPLGGFVNIEGMTVEQAAAEETPRERAYIYAPIWVRLSVVLGGVFANLLLAWAAATAIAFAAIGEVTVTRVLSAPLYGLVLLGRITKLSTLGLWQAVSTGGDGVSTVLTLPVDMQTGVAEAAGLGMSVWVYGLFVFFVLNIGVAVANVLPLAPFDGYHAFVAVLDGIRKIHARIKGTSFQPLRGAQLRIYAGATGVAVIGSMAFLLVRDAFRLSGF